MSDTNIETYNIYMPTVGVDEPPVDTPFIPIHGIDVSAYQDNTIPWQYYYDGGMRKVVVKGCQDINTQAHISMSRMSKFDVDEYYWHYPNVSISYQLDNIKRDFNLHRPSQVWLDVEQWWSNWNEYWEYLAGKRKKENVAVINHKLISDSAYKILSSLKTSLDVPVGIYTARWVQEEFAPEIAEWISEFDLWVASYIDLGKQKYKVTMEEYMSMPKGSPLMPFGATKWKVWQFSSRLILPGYYSALDCNIWNN